MDFSNPISRYSFYDSSDPAPTTSSSLVASNNSNWSSGLTNFLGQLTDVAKAAGGAYNTYQQTFNPVEPPAPISPPVVVSTPPPAWYNPAAYLDGQNLTAADFAFTPNYKLFLAGAALLIVALVLKK